MRLSFDLKEIRSAAEKVFGYGKNKKVWALHGEMGSGKTTFIHALCESLGVTSSIGSPTYAIINEYESDRAGIIYHMDWYRLKDEEEALQAGVEECLLSGNFCLIEWPDRAPSLLPADTFHISISILNEQTRLISII